MFAFLLSGCVSTSSFPTDGAADEPDAPAPTPPTERVPNARTVRLPGGPVGTDELDVEHLPDPEDELPHEDLGPRLLYGGAILDVGIELDARARASLAMAPHEEVEGAFVYGGRIWRVGVRLKGTSSLRTLDGKPSFRLDFNAIDPDGDFYGVKHVTLNNMIQDETMLREDAYYWLCAQLDVPAPRHGWARVAVDGAAYGLYGVVEAMDDQFVEAHWPDDAGGALYESSGDDLTEASCHFETKEEGEGDVEELVDDLAAVLAAPAPGEVLAAVDRHFDRDALFTYWALDIAGGNDDGYVFNRHNYHLYYAPVEGRWSMIPWGVDRAFEDRNVPVHGDALLYPYVGQLAIACLADAVCLAELDATLLATMDAWEDLDLVGHVEATRDFIAPDAEDDPRAEDRWEPEEMVDFAEDAPDWVRAQLGGSGTPP